MSQTNPPGGRGASLYRSRVGEPSTDDEVLGYWVFVFGALAGVIGVALFLASDAASGLREAAIVLAAAGLMFLLIGPVIRLPLRRAASSLSYAGAVVCAVSILYFTLQFPENWSTETGNQPSIVGYAAGMALVVVGAVVVPLLAGPSREEEAAERAALEEEIGRLQTSAADADADEADLASVVAELRRAIADGRADEADLAARLRGTRSALADTEADEADLADQLGALRTSQARFELYEDAAGEWRWRLRHRNGNVVADSGESYTRRHNAQKGMASVRRNALAASVLLFEDEAELPDEEEAFEPAPEAPSRATFELYEDNAGEHRWRLRHDNGEILADSGEGYASRGNLRRAIESVRLTVGPAGYLKADPTAYEVYRDEADEWRWRLIHRNGEILADGGEGYASGSNARRAVENVRERATDADAFEVYEDSAGEWRWRLASGNDVIADSGEGYADRNGAEEAVERVVEYAPEADALDVGIGVFEVYEDAGGEHRWRLRARNGNVLADSGEGYGSRTDAHDGLSSVKRNAPGAEAEE